MYGRFPRSLLLALLLSTPAWAETVTLTPSKDNTLFESPTGSESSGSGTDVYTGQTVHEGVRRALLAFDVSVIPSDALIDSVSLELSLTHVSDPGPSPIRIYRVLADWGEGASVSPLGDGAPSQAGDATWIHTFYPGSFWSKPGGDFSSTASDSTDVQGFGTWIWHSAGLASDVHAWTSQTAANYGWIMIGQEGGSRTARGFSSSEGGTPPRLVVHYSVATPVNHTTWGKIKIRYR